MSAAHDFPINSRVLVRNFGTHKGTVVDHDPIVCLPAGWGRGEETRERKGWVAVRLDSGRSWAGTPDHLQILLAHGLAMN